MSLRYEESGIDPQVDEFQWQSAFRRREILAELAGAAAIAGDVAMIVWPQQVLARAPGETPARLNYFRLATKPTRQSVRPSSLSNRNTDGRWIAGINCGSIIAGPAQILNARPQPPFRARGRRPLGGPPVGRGGRREMLPGLVVPVLCSTTKRSNMFVQSLFAPSLTP